MLKVSGLAVAGLLLAVPAGAQDVQPREVPLPVVPRPAVTQSPQQPATQLPQQVLTQAQQAQQLAARQARAAQQRSQQQIIIFEGVLRQAVRNGALSMWRQVQQVAPAPELVLSEPAEVSGFHLSEYATFFSVRVPGIRPPVALLMRLNAEQTSRVRGRQGQGQGQGSTVAVATPAGLQLTQQAPPPAPFVDRDVADDLGTLYTAEVKNALVDAMLENSASLRIPPNEFLIVAARDSAPVDQLLPGDRVDYRTLMFRIKGADLSAYQTGQITIDEAKKRIALEEE